MRRGSKRPVAKSVFNKASPKEMEGINALFEKYQDPEIEEEPTIGPEGVEKLCEDLGVSPADIRVLMLAWKLGAARMGYFSLEEWRGGMQQLRVDGLDKLKKALPELEAETHSPAVFREFFRYAFQFCCTEARQKTLDLDTASQMLGLVMPHAPLLPPFLEFLQVQQEYKALTLDQWTGFLRFCEETDVDVSNYDESQAWPLLIDNFVDWIREKQQAS